MKGKAPLPVHPCGAVGLRCAKQMCGRDARVPGWASSTQLTGNMVCTTPRIGARRRLQGPKRPTAEPPGNAGVPPATLFLPGGGGASAQRCRQAATLPACTALASPNERQCPVTVPSLRRSRPTLCQANVRAGRPRSRGGIFHTTNREHDLHHAQEWGKRPFARLKNHPRERGRLARNLISAWRWWSVSATLPAGSHPAGVNAIGQSE